MFNPDSVSRIVLILAAAALGASVGSFLNVCIYRIPLGLTVNRPRRSFCPSCGHLVEARDNIPVLSWLWLRRRCRYCKSQISIWYFLIELLSGISTALAFVTGGFIYAASFLFLFSLLCIAIRTRHSDYQLGLLFLILLVFAVASVLQERGTTPSTAPIPLLISTLAGLLIAFSWTGRKNWRQTLVVICAALACGSFISMLLAAVGIISGRYKHWRKELVGLDDALLLIGVCAGSVVDLF